MTLGEAPERAHLGRNGLNHDDPPPAAPARRLSGRRRALPTGRAVVGGLLVAMAAVIVFAATLRGTDRGGTANFVVASHPIEAGSVIEPGDLQTVSLRLPREVSAGAYTSAGMLMGRTLAVTIGRGELVQSSALVPAGQTRALRPVTVAVEPAALVGLYTGEPVDVLQTSGSDTSTSVTVVVRGAALFAVSRPGSNVLSGPASATVTLGVASLQEVESVVAAAHAGTVTIVAASPEDGVGPGPGGAGSSAPTADSGGAASTGQ